MQCLVDLSPAHPQVRSHVNSVRSTASTWASYATLTPYLLEMLMIIYGDVMYILESQQPWPERWFVRATELLLRKNLCREGRYASGEAC